MMDQITFKHLLEQLKGQRALPGMKLQIEAKQRKHMKL